MSFADFLESVGIENFELAGSEVYFPTGSDYKETDLNDRDMKDYKQDEKKPDTVSLGFDGFAANSSSVGFVRQNNMRSWSVSGHEVQGRGRDQWTYHYDYTNYEVSYSKTLRILTFEKGEATTVTSAGSLWTLIQRSRQSLKRESIRKSWSR